jgi:hypothetical protein
MVLRGIGESPALPMVETDNILHIAEGARQAMIEAERSAIHANNSDLSIMAKLKYYDDHYFENRKMQRILENRMKAYEDRLARILEFLHDEGVFDGNKLLREIEKEQAQPGTGTNKEKELPEIPESYTLWKGIKSLFKDE